MLTHPKTLKKFPRLDAAYSALRFERVLAVPVEFCETHEYLRREPEGPYTAIEPGTRWGGPWVTGWFRGTVEIPAALAGKRVFVEGLLAAEPVFTIVNGETQFYLDGEAFAAFDRNHSHVLLTPGAKAGARHRFTFECYSGHGYPGVLPHDVAIVVEEKSKHFGGVYLATEREDVSAFVFDVRALNQLIETLDEHSLRRAEIVKGLARVHATVRALPQEQEESDWRPRLAEARAIMRPLLDKKNGPTVPAMDVMAHSHIDTMWLWPYAETWRKCARTFSTMVNLLERYPEVVFMQSAPIHLESVRNNHPALFQRIKALVKEGRWEPNGGAWLEPDCNIPSGESLVRQFLKGQRWTAEHLDGYRGDTFWQPDVFGYSAALPQILRGCGIPHFNTTKMAWNDTVRFPYDSFVWRGIDGSEVVTHLSAIPEVIDPKTLDAQWKWAQHKDGEQRRLLAYGHGDGGGGPMSESMEMIRRLNDLEGAPRCQHSTLSAFMQRLAEKRAELPVWTGELYLELHRGTLTSWAPYKRYNRKIELALRDTEYLATLAMLAGAVWPAEELEQVWAPLLQNQFHDVIPGTSIAEANVDALAMYEQAWDNVRVLRNDTLRAVAPGAPEAGKPVQRLLVVNTLNWARTGEMTFEHFPEGMVPADPKLKTQWVEDIEGHERLTVHGLTLPPMGAAVIDMMPAEPRSRTESATGSGPFTVASTWLETPHARLEFGPGGAIASFYDKHHRRELVKPGGLINGFLLGEDVPDMWDAWDIDADQRRFLKLEDRLMSREVLARGPNQLRIRSLYRLGERSGLLQDLVFHSSTPRVDFETAVNWHETHRLLKVGFDLAIHADTARHEIQFGHVERPLHENYPADRARFEVCAHKWTDLSENGFGIALLNDCKYGVGARPGELRLSLIKSGTKPDPRADEGRHVFSYALLPHSGNFSVEHVVHPAWEFNVAPLLVSASADAEGFGGLFTLNAPNIIVESVKRAEDGEGIIVRLSEAARLGRHVRLTTMLPLRRLEATNMLEEQPEPLDLLNEGTEAEFYMRPFEVKTLRLVP